jgi:hypothetical protein
MKKLGILALLLSLSVATIGCQKAKEEPKAAEPAAAEGGAAPAAEPAKTE